MVILLLVSIAKLLQTAYLLCENVTVDNRRRSNSVRLSKQSIETFSNSSEACPGHVANDLRLDLDIFQMT